MGIYKIYSRIKDKGKIIYRTEFINTRTNTLFRNAKSAQDVKRIFQSFWNIDRRGPRVSVDKVIKVQSKSRKANWGIKLLK